MMHLPGDPDKLLRWKYGKWREQRKASEKNKNPNEWFSTFNVLIEKTVFAKIRFNEELKQYGYEDTLMGYQLKKADIEVLHIDNGLIHEGLETNKEFLNKTKLGIENLSKLYENVTDKKTFSQNGQGIENIQYSQIFQADLSLCQILYTIQRQNGNKT